MAQAADNAGLTNGTSQISQRARSRIASMKDSADCQIRVADTVFPHLHKVVLAMESVVLRSLVKSIPSCSTITLHDDPPSEVALLISLIYNRNAASMTGGNIKQILGLCKKYNLPDVYDAAKTFLLTMELTTSNFTSWLEVARSNQLSMVVKRYLQYAADYDNLRDIIVLKGMKWLDTLDAADQLHLVVPALQEAYTNPQSLKRRYY